MILDFEAPQWTSVFKAALHFNLIRLLRRAVAHLEELLPAAAIWALGAAYQYRRWLPPGVAPARPRKYGLTHPTWCIPWELTPAERVLFRRFGKWAPRTYVRRIDEPEIMVCEHAGVVWGCELNGCGCTGGAQAGQGG
jgi:hypothetical protein